MRIYNSVFCLLIVFFISFESIGQSLNFRPQQTSFFSNADTQQVAHVTVFNHTSNSLNIKVKRVSNVLASSHVSNFCWGPSCYGPATNLSIQADTILSNDSNTTFKGYLEPNGADGVSKVGYCFFDENHINDSICINFIYHFGALGITERKQSIRVSEAYPNPTKNFTSISYSLPTDDKIYVLKLFNIQGKLMSEQNIKDKNAVILLPMEGFKSGIYQASLFLEDKCLLSRKIILLP